MTKLAQLLCGLTLAVLWLPAGRAEDVDSGDIAIKFGANGSTDSVDLNITGTDVTWGSLFYPGNGKSINITGNGYAINATADGAFIYEDAESYTFAASDLIFNNTTSTRRTYSLLHLTGVNASATLNFDEVTFQNFHNTDGEGSGAVINIHGGANATVNVGPGGLVFLNNDGTLSSGGAVGLLSNNSTLTFNGPGLVSFLDNSTDYYGGAISQSYNSSLTFASDVLFEGNHAQSFGGAIDIWGYSGTTLFSGSSVFRNNYVYTSASGNGVPGFALRGGAINIGYIDGGKVVRFAGPVSFIGNRVISLATAGNQQNAVGGAISTAMDGTGDIFSYQFDQGAVFDGNFVYSANGNGYGGAAFFEDYGSRTFGPGSQFTNNYASTLGGAIYYTRQSVTLNASDAGDILFQGNRQAASFTGSGTDITPVAGSGSANAIYMTGGTLALNATGTGRILFYDPIASATTAAIVITKTGAGDAVFYQYASAVTATTTVGGGRFIVRDGAVFGGTLGRFAVGGSGTLVLSDSAALRTGTLALDGALNLDLDGPLGSRDAFITSGTATLGGTLTVNTSAVISGTRASELAIGAQLLITTTAANGLGGDFVEKNLAGSGTSRDFIVLDAYKDPASGNKNYVLGGGLAWFSATTFSHGNFTLGAGEVFDVDVNLSATTAHDANGGAPAWDGATLTLTASNSGTLALSATNHLAGLNVLGGWLVNRGWTSGELLVDGGATFLNTGGTAYLTATNAVIGGTGAGWLVVESGTVNVENTLTLGRDAGAFGSGTVLGGGVLAVGGDMVVGADGNGALTVAPGGAVAVGGNSYIGRDAIGTGTAAVSGNGLWTTGSILYVGHGGAGSLIVSGGTVGAEDQIDVGFNSGANGLLAVSGSGAVETTRLLVGHGYPGGSGTLTLDGGVVSVTLGQYAVTNPAYHVFIVGGNSGTGALLMNGGTVTAPFAIIGLRDPSLAGGIGTGSMGAGAFLGSDQLLAVGLGEGATGSLDIGAMATGSGGLVGIGVGVATGTVSVGGLFQSGGDLWVGGSAPMGGADYAGTGTGWLFVAGSGTVTAGGAYAQDAASTLTLDLAGLSGTRGAFITAQSATLSGTLVVANYTGTASGTKASTLAQNAQVLIRTQDGFGGTEYAADNKIVPGGTSTHDFLVLGAFIVGGTDYVLGSQLAWYSGTQISHGNFTLGAAETFNVDVTLSDTNPGLGAGGWDGRSLTKQGEGTLILSASNNYSGTTLVNGGTLQITGWTGGNAAGYIGGAGASGWVVVSGTGHWGMAGDLHVGAGSEGVLTGADTAQITTGGAAYIDDGSGTVAISGSAWWDVAGDLYVGTDGTGNLLITDSGSVTVGGTSFIGYSAGATGAANVAGLWSSNGAFIVGASGTGLLTVAQGGTLSTTGTVSLGDAASSSGSAGISGYWTTNNNGLTVGNFGAGWLDIAQGGTLANAAANLGRATGVTGSVNVAGLWINNGLVTIGAAGNGVVTVAQTGTVLSTGGVSFATGGGTGSLTIAGLWSNTGNFFNGAANRYAVTLAQTGSLVTTGSYTNTAFELLTVNLGMARDTAYITATAGAVLSGSLTVNNFTGADPSAATKASDVITDTKLVLRAVSGTITVNSSFSGTVTGLAGASRDYLHGGVFLANGGHDLVAGYGLRWYAADNNASGNFTLGAGETFEIDALPALSGSTGYGLVNTNRVGTLTLTSSNSGTLLLSATNVFSSIDAAAGALAISGFTGNNSVSIGSVGGSAFEHYIWDNSAWTLDDSGSTAALAAALAVSGTLEAGYLYVGNSGSGTLDITGQVVSGHTAIGSAQANDYTEEYAGSDKYTGAFGAGSGSASVSGWWSASNLYVGYGGTGALTIAGSGSVTAAGVSIGDAGASVYQSSDGSGYSYTETYASSYGRVEITGGGLLAVTGTLTAGNAGVGVLAVSGGTVSAGGVVIGAAGATGDGDDSDPSSVWSQTYAAGSGTATISGSGVLATTGNLIVGDSGSGALTVTDSGTVGSGAVYIGSGTTGVGTATVSGAAVWSAGDTAIIGNSGTGYLTVSGGTFVTQGAGASIVLGQMDDSYGRVAVSGGLFQTGDHLTVGNGGTGVLAVSGGTAQAGNIEMAMLYDFSATVSISGGGLLHSLGYITNGDGAAANLAVAGSGSVRADGSYSQNAGSTLDLTLSGSLGSRGAFVTAGTAYLSGTLTASATSGTAVFVNGGSASALANNTQVLIHTSTINGDFTTKAVSGGTSTHDFLTLGAFIVGGTDYVLGSQLTWFSGTQTAHGNFTLNSGETFTVDVNLHQVATPNVSDWDGGTLTLTASNSGTLILSGSNTLAGLDILGGWLVNKGWTSDDLYINGGSAENIAGAYLTATNAIVGDDSAGFLLVGGGTVNVENHLTIGAQTGGSGTVSVADGARVLAGNSIVVGLEGTGVLAIAGGTVTAAQSITFGASHGGFGSGTVTAGLLRAGGELLVGYVGGTGALTITGGTVAAVNYGIQFGDDDGAVGTGTVSGGLLDSGAWIILGNQDNGGGTGRLTVTGSGLVRSAGDFMNGQDTGGTGPASGFLAIAGSGSVHAGSTYAQNAQSHLAIDITDPARTSAYLTAQSATLSGSLTVAGASLGAVSGSASGLADGSTLLIRTTGSLFGDFDAKDAGGISTGRNYLIADTYKANGDLDYVVGYQLAWFGGTTIGSGSFHLDDHAFLVDVSLANQTGSFATGWDGRSLTKTGTGALILSASNTYTGTTTVSGGVLAITGWTGSNAAGWVNGGVVNVSGGGLWRMANRLDVSGGTLAIIDTGSVGAEVVSLSDTGAVAVGGTGVLVADDSLVLESYGSVSLAVRESGTVRSLGNATLYADPGGFVALTVSDSAAVSVAGGLQIYGEAGGTATVTVTNSGSLAVGGTLTAAAYDGAGAIDLGVSGTGLLAVGGDILLDAAAVADTARLAVSDHGLVGVSGNFIFGAGGVNTLAVSDSGSVWIGGTYAQNAGGLLDLTLTGTLNSRGAYVTAASGTLSGTLTVNAGGTAAFVNGGSASALANNSQVLIRTGTISGGFDTVTVTGGTSTHDFLTLGAFIVGGTDYVLGSQLTWYSGTATAHGNFTLGAGETFTVDVPLNNTATPNTSGWDGASLTVTASNSGTLILSASNNYSGTTTVNGGVLEVTGWTGSTAQVNIASAANSSGTVSVSGYLGTANSGINVGGWQASDTNAHGILNLTGTAAGSLNVGRGTASTGEVNVSGNGALFGNSDWIGNNGALGTVNVTDSGSWSNGWLYVGYWGGTGVVNVSGTGVVTATTAYIGYYSYEEVARGELNVSGSGWFQAGELSIGHQGFGTGATLEGAVTLTDSGSVTAGNIVIANSAGGGAVTTGSASVGGNALLASATNIILGNGTNSAALAVSGSGLVTAGGAYAQNAQSTLTLDAAGDGVTARGAGDAFIYASSATVGGTISVSGFATGSAFADAQSVVNSGHQVLISATSGTISGVFASATLAGVSALPDYLYGGIYKTTSGSSYVAGVNLAWFGDAASGHGNFTVAGGTSFDVNTTLSDTMGLAGSPAYASGWDGRSLTVTASNSGTLILSGSNTHTGTTTVNGGALAITGWTGSNAAGLIDGGAGGAANLIVSGSGYWGIVNGGDLRVGKTGTGSLTITGGTVNAGSFVYLGYDADAVGTGTVGGGGLLGANMIIVGEGGVGSLSVTGGVVAANTWISIGDSSNGLGTVGVGAGGLMTSGNNITVGNSGTGALVIAQGGTASAVGEIRFGYLGGVGSGTVGGVLAGSSNFYVGSDLGGTGALAVGGSGSVTAGGAYTQNTRSTLDLTLSGSLGSRGAFITAGSAQLSGTLTVNATGTAAFVNGGSASALANNAQVLLHTGGISGDFAAKSVSGGTSQKDFLTFGAFIVGGTDYVLGTQLTWLSGTDRSHGNFTLGEGEVFNVDVALGNTTPHGANLALSDSWDGASLTVTSSNRGDLILSASNSYSGTTLVNGGTLTITGYVGGTAGVIGSGSGTDGTVNLSGSGQWRMNGSAPLNIGNNTGTGALAITDSGTVTAGGVGIGATGLVAVGGAGHLGGGQFSVNGRLDAAGSAVVASTDFRVSSDALASGTAGVSGSAFLDVSGGGLIGYYSNTGTSTLALSESGSARFTGLSVNPTRTAGAGLVTVSGTSRLDITDYLAFGGSSYMNISGSGAVAVGGTVSFGQYAADFGVLAVGDSGALAAAGDFILGYSGAGTGTGQLNISGSGLVTAGGTYAQNANSTLALTVENRGAGDAFIYASSATVGGTISVSGFATGSVFASASSVLGSGHQVLISATSGTISGVFASATLAGAAGSLPDYLYGGIYKTDADTKYVAGVNLAWFGGAQDGRGNFTVAGGTSFDVNTTLSDTVGLAGSPAYASGWDGRSLTVTASNSGTLILSGSNTYTGTTTVNGGALAITGWTGSTAAGVVGATPGDSGAVAVGNGGYWQAQNDILVGGGGAGALAIAAGGTVHSLGGSEVGWAPGGSGSATVGGAWRSEGMMIVGDEGSGALAVPAGGLVSSGMISAIGLFSGTGTATVSGWWDSGSDFYTGYFGNGALTVTDSGSVTVGGGLFAGFDAGGGLAGSGSIAVTGSGLLATAGNLTLGVAGTGALSVDAAGRVAAGGDITLGGTDTGSGTPVTGTGAGSGSAVITGGGLVSAAGNFYNGDTGAGALTIGQSGSIGAGGTYAQNAGSTLTLMLDGTLGGRGAFVTAAAANLAGTLVVHATGTASGTKASTLADHVQVLIRTGTLTGDFAGKTVTGGTSVADYLAYSAFIVGGTDYVLGSQLAWHTGTGGAHGNFTLGAGETFEVDVALADAAAPNASGWDGQSLAKLGDGLLILSASNGYSGTTFAGGGTLAITGHVGGAAGYIAGAGTTAWVTVGGSGSWGTAGDLHVGGSGTGYLAIAGGGRVSTGGTAFIDDGFGQVDVSGTAFWQVAGDLFVGTDGTGSLLISESGSVSTAGHGYLGYSATATGTATVGGGGFWSSATTFYVGYSGTGALVLGGSGSIGTAQDAYLGYNNNAAGAAAIGGAALWTAGADFYNGLAGTGSLALRESGSLAVGGTYFQNAQSTLALALEPGRTTAYLTARTAALGGALVVDGFTGTTSGTRAGEVLAAPARVLIRTTGTITGDFAAKTINGGTSPVDYLTHNAFVATGGTDYVLGTQLTWQSGTALAHGTFTVGPGGAFEVDVALADESPANASGWDGGSLTKAGAGLLVLSASNSYTGSTSVQAGELRVTHTAALGAGLVDIAGGATLTGAFASAYTFASTLQGAGLLAVDLGASTPTFNFASGALSAGFTGTAALRNSTFTLTGGALANATLSSGSGNRTLVGTGTHTLAGLALDGGRVDFDTNVPADIVSPAFVAATGTIHLASGTVGVRIPQSGTAPAVAQTPLLQQDDGALTRLASSATTTGNIGGIALVDLATGALVSATQSAAISQSGTQVATGTYGYGLAGRDASANNGLHVSYGLVAVDILAGRTLLLDSDTTAPAGGNDFKAVITGSGHLALSPASAITLNASNRYTGTTLITGGTLIAGADDALGRTSHLALAANAAYDLAGNTQTLGGGRIDGALLGSGSLGLGGNVDITGTNAAFAADIGVTGTTTLHHTQALGATGATAIAADAELLLVSSTGAFSKRLGGQGRFALAAGSTVALTGANTAFGGTFAIAQNTALGAGSAAHLGSAALAADGLLTLSSTAAETLANALGGSGTFVKDGAGNLTIARSNAFTGVTTVAGGTLTLSDLHGTGTGDITNHAALVLAASGIFANNLLGSGTTIIDPGVILTGSNALAAWDVTASGTASVTQQQNLGDAATHVDGRLVITASAGWNYANALTGTGVLSVDTSGSAFAFTPAALPPPPAGFHGTLALGHSAFDLSGVNTAALADATLQLDDGNHTTVGSGTQQIGNLALASGTITFTLGASGTQADGIVSTGVLDVRDTVIRVDTGSFTGNGGLPLLRQDEGMSLLLVQSDTLAAGSKTLVTGSHLVDQNGSSISSAAQNDIVQSGTLTASGTYNFAALAGNTGLHLAYTLTALDLLAGRTTVLDHETAFLGAITGGTTPGGHELHALVSGSGNLQISATGAIWLNNPANTYTGATLVTGGTLVAGASGALGHTAFLSVSDSAAFNLNHTTQTLAGGLILGADGLQGTGTLHLAAGLLDIHAANTGFAALVATTGTVRLAHVQGLGDSGTLALDSAAATLILDTAAGGTFATAFSGSQGSFIKDGASAVAIARANAFGGTAAIRSGTLAAAHIAALGTASVDIAAGAAFEYRGIAAGVSQNTFSGSGALSVISSTLAIARDNTMALVSIDNAVVTMRSSLALGAAATVVTLHNAASALRIDTPGARLGTLHLNGGLLAFAEPAGFAAASAAAYHRARIETLGAGPGRFEFNVDFTGAAGLMTPAAGMKANSLVIAADAAAPHQVRVHYTGQPGTQSASFELIATGNGLAEFALDTNNGKIDFGLTAYELNRGDGSPLMPVASNWYLADTGLSNAADVILDTASTIPLDWNTALDSLHLRMGEVRAENLPATRHPTPAASSGNLWVRSRAYRMNATNSVTGRGFDQYGGGLTAGMDKLFPAGTAASLLGAFIDMGSISRDFDRRGDNTSNSVTLGAYLTRLHDDGWFADAVVRAGRYINKIDARTPDLRSIQGRYTSRALGGSIEAGRRLRRAGGWWLEPALQASLLWLSGDSFETSPESLRLHVAQDSLRSAQYRALLRFGRQSAGGKWNPYGRLGAAAVDSDGGTLHAHDKHLSPSYDGKRVEFGFGASYRINDSSQWHADYEYATARHYQRPWSLNLGYRRLW